MDCFHLPTAAGDEVILPTAKESSTSSHGAETRGMPHAIASKGRMVGMPRSART